MDLFKKILLTLVAVAMVVGFSACSDDNDYVVRGELVSSTVSYERPPRTDNSGWFYEELILDVNNIKGYTARDYLVGIELYNSSIAIEPVSGFHPAYVGGLVSLTFYADRVGEFEYLTHIDSNGLIYIDTRDRNFGRFMSDVFYELSRSGRVYFGIEGVMRQDNYNRTPIQFYEFDIFLESELGLVVRR